MIPIVASPHEKSVFTKKNSSPHEISASPPRQKNPFKYHLKLSKTNYEKSNKSNPPSDETNIIYDKTKSQ